jgi:hypothetical protein
MVQRREFIDENMVHNVSPGIFGHVKKISRITIDDSKINIHHLNFPSSERYLNRVGLVFDGTSYLLKDFSTRLLSKSHHEVFVELYKV